MSTSNHLRADNRHAPARIHYPAMLKELRRNGGPSRHYDPGVDDLTDRQAQVRDEIMDRVWGMVPVKPVSMFDALFGADPRASLAKVGVR